MPRFFAIVPAAGHSTRMGEPKLLLPLAARPMIAHVLSAWQKSGVNRVLVVVRPGDERLAEVVRAAGAECIVPPVPPPDMKASIQAALQQIESDCSPGPMDAFLVAPADMPRLSSAVIDALIGQHRADRAQILAPTLAGRRGHPVLFPWTLAGEVQMLTGPEGLDAVVRRHPTREIACDWLVVDDGSDPFADLDTPDDYRRIT